MGKPPLLSSLLDGTEILSSLLCSLRCLHMYNVCAATAPVLDTSASVEVRCEPAIDRSISTITVAKLPCTHPCSISTALSRIRPDDEKNIRHHQPSFKLVMAGNNIWSTVHNGPASHTSHKRGEPTAQGPETIVHSAEDFLHVYISVKSLHSSQRCTVYTTTGANEKQSRYPTPTSRLLVGYSP